MTKQTDEMIRFEYQGVYDGWILEFNYQGEINWRNHPVVENLTKEKKEEIEGFVKLIILNEAN